MRTLYLIIIGAFFAATSFAQDNFVNKMQIEIGYMDLSNKSNMDQYYKLATATTPYNNQVNISGANLKCTFPSSKPYLDYVFGALVIKSGYSTSYGFSSGHTNASSYILNGGGVYGGISPKLKFRNFGLTSDLALGCFSFKEYIGMFNNENNSSGLIDAHEKKASYGLGSMAAVGFYVRFWRIGINPTYNFIFSGGSGTSFMFHGFNFPITIQL